MKELETHKIQRKAGIEISQEQNQKQEYRYVGSIRLKTGCSMFSFDPITNKMTKIVTKGNATIDFSGNISIEKKAQYNPNNLYFQAINEKNAWRKLSKYKNGDKTVLETFENKKYESLNKFW